MADVAIIGGGVIGLSIAYSLAQAGIAPLLIDAGAPSASAAAAGMLAPSFEHGAGAVEAPLRAFAAESYAAWPGFAVALAEESGVDIDARFDGMLSVAASDQDIDALRREANALGRDANWLEGAALRDFATHLSADFRAGLWAPGNGQVDPRRVCLALTQSLGRRAVEIRRGAVVEVRHARGRFTARLANGETFDAARLVLANGAQAARIETPIKPAPIFPVKGEALAISAGDQFPAFVVRTPGAYFCPKAGGRLVIGATQRPQDWSIGVDHAAVEALRARADRAVPALRGAPELERWAGLRPATPDGAPIIGAPRDGPEGMFLALGHYRNGVLFSPLTAKIIRDLILGVDPDRALVPFRLERFAE